MIREKTETAGELAERFQAARKHVVMLQADPTLLDVVRELLEDAKYNVTTTTVVPTTFDALVAMQPNLLIADLLFGKILSWELLERLTRDALSRDIPVIVTSTDQSLLDRAKSLGIGEQDRRFLIKPFELTELLDAVHELIGDA